jgi:hypothetical protein
MHVRIFIADGSVAHHGMKRLAPPVGTSRGIIGQQLNNLFAK